MRLVLATILILFFVSACSASSASGYKKLKDDPADSWLAYAVARGGGKRVTRVNATWVVPDYPTQRYGGNAPGWWYGIEPNPAANLIQPILAYGYTGAEYSIFNGYYQWDNSYWWHSSTGRVTPGQHINASVWYDKPNDSYLMYIGCKETGWSVVSTIPVEQGKIYTDTYFVVEHQPNSCSEYPSNGYINFENIYIELEGKPITPTWDVEQYQDACGCVGAALSPSELKFSWNTRDSTDENVLSLNM